jgi:hypothetical protein
MNEDEFFILCQFQTEADLALLSAYREIIKKAFKQFRISH